MKYFRKDILIVAAGTAVITAFAYLYYKDITTKVQAGSREVIGTITYKRKIAERKYTGQVIWEDLDNDVPVYNNDSIRTADQSEAIVHLNDKTEIKLNENSMILLSLDKNQFNIEFNQGSISTSREDTTGNIKDLNIKSGNTNVSIKNSNVKLSQNKAGDLNLSVAKGKANINTGKGEETLGTDQSVVIDNKSGSTSKIDTGIELISPAGDSYHLTASGKKKMDFSWKNPEGKYIVYFELSANELFNGINNKKPVKNNNFSAELDKGIYYWRVRALQRGTKKQKFSESRRFTVLWDEPVIAISPANRETIGYKTILPVVNFKWTKSEVASGYRFILAGDPEMNNIIKTVETVQNSIVLDTLNKGSYYWKIEKITGLKDIPELSPGNVFEFKISEKEIIGPPELIFPGNAKQFSKLLLEKQSITFTWKNNPDIKEYLFSAAKDDRFENIIHEEISKVNFVNLEKKLQTGNYYWRVTARLGDNETVPSATRTFSVIDMEEIRLIIPEKNAVLAPEEDEKTAAVRFSWKGSEIKGKYKLQISKSEDFSSLYNETIVRFPSSSAALQINPGTYYWKVSLLDEEETILASSPSLSFSVEDYLKKPAATSPLNGWVVNMSNKDILTLNWNKVEGANLYRISLYQDIKGKDHLIAEISDNITSYKITDLQKLDESAYYWTLQAFETGKNKNEIKRKSRIVKNNFKITLGKPVDKVNVNSLKIENL
jgi:hypothetical protein